MPKEFRSTSTMFAHLKKLLDGSVVVDNDQSVSTLAYLPSTTFSELLRVLDPVNVSKDLDPTAGMQIGPGMAQFTHLGQLLNRWGVRKANLVLLTRLMAAVQVRLAAGRGLLLSDYKILLRCAGAVSDTTAAKKVWHLMLTQGHISLRDTDAYNEFVKARFLTEPLYTQYDMARFRVQPLDLHRSKISIQPRRLQRLQRLRGHILRRQYLRYGQNYQTIQWHEPLVRILRKKRPILRVWNKVLGDGIGVDERYLSSAMVAFARNGSLNHILRKILAKHWRIVVGKDKNTGEITVGGGTTVFPQDSPMYPTERLLEAVVQSFGANAEIATAFKLVDFISRRYGIPVPNKVWFNLLQWTYVQSSKPASTEWKRANWPGKTLRPNAVQLVWDTMTSEPYNVRPGFDEYNILIKTLLEQRKFKQAMETIIDVKSHYKAMIREHEDAFCEHVHFTAQHVNPAGSFGRWARARAKKAQAWYNIQFWCWKFLKRYRTNRSDDELALRLLPQFIEAFRDFMPKPVRYRIATGEISIRDVAPVTRFVFRTHDFLLPPLMMADGPSPPAEANAGEEHGGTDAAFSKWQKGERSRVFRLKRRRFLVRRPLCWEPDLKGFQNEELTRASLEREFL
jgi:hypothetical protein